MREGSAQVDMKVGRLAGAVARVSASATVGVAGFGPVLVSNKRMHLPKPRAPWSDAVRYPRASLQVIRGR